MDRRLVLFDVDGTLLDCGGRTRPILERALETTYGTIGSLQNDGFAGKTDDQIVYDALLAGGLSEADVAAALPDAKSRYLLALSEGLRSEDVRLLPGVVETLERLTARASVQIALLTGNWRLGALCKLRHLGLDAYFVCGAFGDGCRSRAELPPLALTEAERHFGRPFLPRQALIVGDTPNDVACARAHGIAVVGLGTGFSDPSELAAAGADWVFEDLIHADFLEWVLE